MTVFCVPCVAHRDPIARKLRLRNRRRDSEDSAGADSVLKVLVIPRLHVSSYMYY